MTTRGSFASGDEMMDVTKLILNMGSTAIDVAALVSEVGREMPIASAVLHAFLAVQNNFETVRANKENLEGLRERCSYLTASVVQKCRGSSTELELTPLENCLRDVAEVVKRCGRRNNRTKVLKAASDKEDIEKLNKRLSDLVNDMGFSGVMAILLSNRKAPSNKKKSGASSEDKPCVGKPCVGRYEGQNERALIWAGLYFGVWIIQRLSCNLGLPPNCELASGLADVLTDLAVLFTFSLAQAWLCEVLEADRWLDTVESPWVFIVVPVTAIAVSALGWIRDLEPFECKYLGGFFFDFSHVQFTLYTLGLIVVMFSIWWHFAWAFSTLDGTQIISGGASQRIAKPKVSLHSTYKGIRRVLIIWAILFTYSLIVEGKGFNYRGALLAWVLSLVAVFPIPVSILWLCLTTGIFIQGIGSNRLRFLGCDP